MRKKAWELLHMKLTFEVQINLNLLRKTILNKSIDLLEKTLHKPKKFSSFKKASESINEIKLKRAEKLMKHDTDSYSKQECLDLKEEYEGLEIAEF